MTSQLIAAIIIYSFASIAMFANANATETETVTKHLAAAARSVPKGEALAFERIQNAIAMGVVDGSRLSVYEKLPLTLHEVQVKRRETQRRQSRNDEILHGMRIRPPNAEQLLLQIACEDFCLCHYELQLRVRDYATAEDEDHEWKKLRRTIQLLMNDMQIKAKFLLTVRVEEMSPSATLRHLQKQSLSLTTMWDYGIIIPVAGAVADIDIGEAEEEGEAEAMHKRQARAMEVHSQMTTESSAERVRDVNDNERDARKRIKRARGKRRGRGKNDTVPVDQTADTQREAEEERDAEEAEEMGSVPNGEAAFLAFEWIQKAIAAGVVDVSRLTVYSADDEHSLTLQEVQVKRQNVRNQNDIIHNGSRIRPPNAVTERLLLQMSCEDFCLCHYEVKLRVRDYATAEDEDHEWQELGRTIQLLMNDMQIKAEFLLTVRVEEMSPSATLSRTGAVADIDIGQRHKIITQSEAEEEGEAEAMHKRQARAMNVHSQMATESSADGVGRKRTRGGRRASSRMKKGGS